MTTQSFARFQLPQPLGTIFSPRTPVFPTSRCLTLVPLTTLWAACLQSQQGPLLSGSSAAPRSAPHFFHTVASQFCWKMSPDFFYCPAEAVSPTLWHSSGCEGHMPYQSTAPLTEDIPSSPVARPWETSLRVPFRFCTLFIRNSLRVDLSVTVGAVVMVFVQAYRNSPAISSRVRPCTHLYRNCHTVLLSPPRLPDPKPNRAP